MPARKPTKRWFVYLVKCRDGTLYCGITNDLEKRIAAHNCGEGARYTHARAGDPGVWTRRCNSKPKALKIEYATGKQLSKAQRPSQMRAFLSWQQSDPAPCCLIELRNRRSIHTLKICQLIASLSFGMTAITEYSSSTLQHGRDAHATLLYVADNRGHQFRAVFKIVFAFVGACHGDD